MRYFATKHRTSGAIVHRPPELQPVGKTETYCKTTFMVYVLSIYLMFSRLFIKIFKELIKILLK